MSDQARAEIVREDLFFPKIAEPREIWVFPHDIAGAVAMFAIVQSPYPVPDGLETVVRAIDTACKSRGTGAFGMRKFGDVYEVEAFIRSVCRPIPEYMAWNERKNGNPAPIQFTSRYDGPTDPDNDFIELDALERNAALHIAQQAALL